MRYLRLKQIIPNIVPVSTSTWYRWVAEGRVPQGKLISRNVRVWAEADVLKAVENA